MRIQNPQGINLKTLFYFLKVQSWFHMACLVKLWERVKLHMTSSFFFSNNLSTLPNDKIVSRSKLEAFAEEFKLRHKLFSVMIGWKTSKKKGKLLLTAFSSFLSMFFQSLLSSISLAFRSLLMCHVSQTFSGPQPKTASKMHKQQNRTGLSLKYQYFVQRIKLQSVQG